MKRRKNGSRLRPHFGGEGVRKRRKWRGRLRPHFCGESLRKRSKKKAARKRRMKKKCSRLGSWVVAETTVLCSHDSRNQPQCSAAMTAAMPQRTVQPRWPQSTTGQCSHDGRNAATHSTATTAAIDRALLTPQAAQ
jgi:hypothetical protein